MEALQVKKPAATKVEPSASHNHDPQSVALCNSSNNSTSEAVQSVKELFPHLEISEIEVCILCSTIS